MGLDHEKVVIPENMSSLHYFESRLIPCEAILDSFQQTLEGIKKTIRQHPRLGPGPREVDKIFSNYSNRATAYRSNVKVLLKKCASASQLLNGILNANDQKILREDQRILRQQSERVLYLTRSTVDDSATVRVITFITLIFLTFTSVAVSVIQGWPISILLTKRKAIMEMPMFYLDDSKSLSMSPSLWIYAAVVIPLTGITMGYWWWSLSRKRRKTQSGLTEKSNSSIV